MGNRIDGLTIIIELAGRQENLGEGLPILTLVGEHLHDPVHQIDGEVQFGVLRNVEGLVVPVLQLNHVNFDGGTGRGTTAAGVIHNYISIHMAANLSGAAWLTKNSLQR